MVWALIQTITTDPGKVPLYWGFHFGDKDDQRRRYCLMCNVFKPDRCHHCSVCNRCVLNMDHHCPWINTCIGFFNRKFFLQMLLYINTLLVFSNIINLYFAYEITRKLYYNEVNFRTELVNSLSFIFMYSADIVVMAVLGMFYKFHMKLVFENKTTIETIDKKGQEFDSPYDLGYLSNFHQTMGVSKLLWFLPFKELIGAPKGNGIDWTEVYCLSYLGRIILSLW